MVGNKKIYYSIPYFINVVQWLGENVIIMCGNGLQWDIEILNIHEWLAIALTVQKMIGISLSPARELICSSNNQEQQHINLFVDLTQTLHNGFIIRQQNPVVSIKIEGHCTKAT